MVSFKTLVIFLALGVDVLARDSYRPVTCSTKLDTKFMKHPSTKTRTNTVYATNTVKIYTHREVTITPKAESTTVSETSTTTTTTTAETETDTATVTETETSTESTTIITTSTDYITSTEYSTSTSTSTVPTPASFTPITQNTDYVAKRSLPCRAASKPDGNTLECKKDSEPDFGLHQYVQSVDCIRTLVRTVVKTVTVNGRPRTTTLAPQTETFTTTLIETATSTEYPADVSTTVTTSTSTTVTSTIESTETTSIVSTSTIETVVPAATPYYAACAADNIISTANGGKPITLIQASTGGSFQSIGSSQTAYSCCVLCQTKTNCLASILNGSSCYGLIRTTCTAGQLATDGYYTGSGTAFTISNGACGMIKNAGSL
ncbi:hypothetical protein G7Z17_g1279 [Cylindrodendrum hubeiense]|uniref:Apple domain-containing protein n=1 Tax=Cylindrodendrum hubeiense TaxID=595255 RepID=A0A9P5HGA9_9HYPO|nr:hypothetical protein G7Z17_g1279 [Cylindrodendrum hubeiense]